MEEDADAELLQDREQAIRKLEVTIENCHNLVLLDWQDLLLKQFFSDRPEREYRINMLQCYHRFVLTK